MNLIEYKGSYINGQFVKSQRKDDEWEILSPGDLDDQIMNLSSDYEMVDQAVQSARDAFPGWSLLKLEDRIQYLKKLENVFQENKEEIAQTISRETGKPLWEARTEAGALAGKITITIEYSIHLIDEVRIENALPGVDGVIRYRPKGVMAVLGPFNFPAHLPNGHFIPALLVGNTIIFKPSDKTPAVGQILAEMFHKADFPKGVFNLVQGKAEVGSRLSKHSGVDGVLFTGSYDVGLKIKEKPLSTIGKIWL